MLNKLRRLLLVPAVLLLQAGAVRADAPTEGLKPGEVLDKSSYQKAEGLLPPEIFEHYKQGHYANPIVDWPNGVYQFAPEFLEASAANKGKFKVSEKGHVVDAASGQQPPYIMGFPFPDVDTKDPQAAIKIVWNYFYWLWYYGNIHAESQVNWLAPSGVERRTDQNVNFMFFDGQPKRYTVDNPQNFLSKQLVVALYPADLHGTAALNWRYRDPDKRDSAWAFVPALRRVRAVSPANRSDGFLGSDMSQDDGPFFDGKPEDFNWSLDSVVDQYRLVDPLSLKGESNAVWLPDGGWRAMWDPELKQFGYQEKDWKGISWAPISGALAKRKFYVLTAVPKDRYYLYGKIQLFIDTETFQGAWNRKFNWQGELLNTFQVMAFLPKKYTRPDGAVDYIQGSNMAFQLAENIKQNRATSAGQKIDAKAALDTRIGFESSFFDTQAMSRFGK